MGRHLADQAFRRHPAQPQTKTCAAACITAALLLWTAATPAGFVPSARRSAQPRAGAQQAGQPGGQPQGGQPRGGGRVARRADFWAPRAGFAKERPLPDGVEELAGDIYFDLTLSKPLGIVLIDSPDGRGNGCGIQEILDEGSAPLLLDQVATGEAKGMWVQEGDELVQVEGEDIDRDCAKASQMIGQAGESVMLTFKRSKKGAIQVIFPGNKRVTAPRYVMLSRLADKVGFNSGCSRADGRDPNCWFEDPATGEVYILPLNVPGIIPSIFREGGEGFSDSEFESWVPLRLQPAPKAFADEMD